MGRCERPDSRRSIGYDVQRSCEGTADPSMVMARFLEIFHSPASSADRHEPGLAVSTTSVTADVTVLTARGVLTTRTCAQLGDAAHTQLAEVPRLLIVDLAQLAVLDRNGVDVLVGIAREAGEADIGLCLVVDGTHRDIVTRPLADANVLSLFEIHHTIANALDAMD
jgi:anti-anti-sigma regulatory factor